MPDHDAEKVRENRLRRMAERQGLLLQKSRRRDPLALDYGTYRLQDTSGQQVGQPMSIEDIERYLRSPRDQRGQ